MNKAGKYIIAVVVCFGIIIIYSIISAGLGFKHGGGYFIMALLFGVLSSIWKAITKDSNVDSKSTQKEEPNTAADMDTHDASSIQETPSDTIDNIESDDIKPQSDNVPEKGSSDNNSTSDNPMTVIMNKVFPDGKASINTAVNEIISLGKTTSARKEIEKLFIYESVLFEVSSDKSKHRIVAGAMRRPDNAVTENEALVVYDYIMEQYAKKHYKTIDPMLMETLNASMGNVSTECNNDVITGAYGRYGWDVTNPIPVRGIPAESIYLSSLRSKDGKKIKWNRICSCGADNIKHPIDLYALEDEDGNRLGEIYISPYQNIISRTAPDGLKIV